MRENAIANKSRDPARENSGGYQKCVPPGPFARRLAGVRFGHSRMESGERMDVAQFITRGSSKDVNFDSGGCAVSRSQSPPQVRGECGEWENRVRSGLRRCFQDRMESDLTVFGHVEIPLPLSLARRFQFDAMRPARKAQG